MIADVAAILSAGLALQRARKGKLVNSLDDVAEALAQLPSAEEVLALRPSPDLARRTEALLAKNQVDGLTSAEQAEWDEIAKVEHVVRMAKARAAVKLQSQAA